MNYSGIEEYTESERLSELYAYDILDTENDEELDALVKLAARICNAPIAMINLIDRERQWTKSSVGWDMKEMPREKSFCQYTIQQNHILHVPDATKDNRFKESEFVKGDPNIRFYAGVNIRSSNEVNLGSLCIIDDQQRDLTDDQKESLEILAREVEVRLELRRKSIEIKKKNRELELKANFLSTSAELLFIIDPSSYKIVYLNDTVTEVLGLEKEKLEGAPLSQLSPGKRFLENLNHWSKKGESNILITETRLTTAEGKSRWFGVRIMEAESYWYVTAKNIDKRKQIEQKLNKTLQDLKSAQQMAGVGSYVWNPLTNELNASDEALILLGLDPNKDTLTMESYLEIVQPADRYKIHETIERVIGGGLFEPYNVRIIRPDGEVKYMINRGEITRNKSGAAIKVMGTTQDITKQKINENKILQSLEEKDLMLSEIHHRVKNNLAVISGMLDIELFDSDDKFSTKVLERTKGRIRSMALIHENLYQKEKFTHIPFGKILGELIEIATPTTNTCDEPVYDVNADDISLNINQAIPFALIINQLLASTCSGITNVTEDKKRHIHLTDTENYVQFSITSKNDIFSKLIKDIRDEKALSSMLLTTLLNQLNGKLDVKTEGRNKIQIEFEKADFKGSSASDF